MRPRTFLRFMTAESLCLALLCAPVLAATAADDGDVARAESALGTQSAPDMVTAAPFANGSAAPAGRKQPPPASTALK